MSTLIVDVQKQQKVHWCWVAVTCSIIKYYDPTSWWSQDRLIEHFIRSPRYGKKAIDLSKNKEDPKNFPGLIEDGLRVVQCFRESTGVPTEGTVDYLHAAVEPIKRIVQREIDSRRPVVCGVRPAGSSGEGHAVVITGYEYEEIVWKEPSHPEHTRTSEDFYQFVVSAGGVAYLDYMILTKKPEDDKNNRLLIYHPR